MDNHIKTESISIFKITMVWNAKKESAEISKNYAKILEHQKSRNIRNDVTLNFEKYRKLKSSNFETDVLKSI